MRSPTLPGWWARAGLQFLQEELPSRTSLHFCLLVNCAPAYQLWCSEGTGRAGSRTCELFAGVDPAQLLCGVVDTKSSPAAGESPTGVTSLPVVDLSVIFSLHSLVSYSVLF